MNRNSEKSGPFTTSARPAQFSGRMALCTREERRATYGRTVQCYLPDFDKRTVPSFSDLRFNKSAPPKHPQLPPALITGISGFPSADGIPHKWKTHQGAKTGLRLDVSCCRNDSKKLLKLADLIKDSQLRHCGKLGQSGRKTKWGECRGQSSVAKEAERKGKKSRLGFKKPGADPQLLWWSCELRPFMLL